MEKLLEFDREVLVILPPAGLSCSCGAVVCVKYLGGTNIDMMTPPTPLNFRLPSCQIQLRRKTIIVQNMENFA